jgi:hypothetical protein
MGVPRFPASVVSTAPRLTYSDAQQRVLFQHLSQQIPRTPLNLVGHLKHPMLDLLQERPDIVVVER